jgi:hypothetical protein
MARRDALTALPPEQALAVDVLTVAALKLSFVAAQELVRRIGDWLLNEAEIAMDGQTAETDRTRRFVKAIKTVASEIGHPPLSTDYLAAYKTHKANGDDAIPSLSTIVKHFGSWPHAMRACGYSGMTLPSRIARRRDYKPKRIAKYPYERLIECLVACANELGRIPTIRDYRIWREEAVRRARATGYPNDIPSWRTYCDRFGGWPKALEAAGFSAATEDKVAHWEFSPVCGETLTETPFHHGNSDHGGRHAEDERIEAAREAEVAAAEADAGACQAGDPGRARDRTHGVSGTSGGRRRRRGRLALVPGLASEPLRRGA